MPYFHCPYCHRLSYLYAGEFFHGGGVCLSCSRRRELRIDPWVVALLSPALLAAMLCAWAVFDSLLRRYW